MSNSWRSKPFKKLKNYWAGLNHTYSKYKFTARKKKLPFSLCVHAFELLVMSPCVYCGRSPSNVYRLKRKRGGSEFKYNGVDRIDNSKGYTFDNCQPACHRCNSMKSKLDHDAFVRHVKRIVRFKNAKL